MPETPREWLSAIRAGHQIEEDWRTDVAKILDIYSSRRTRVSRPEGLQDDSIDYNILFANVQVLSAAIYSNPPRPDVRRRFRDKDPVARTISEILERALSYSIDSMPWEQMIGSMKMDVLLAGRSIIRVMYEPKFKLGETAPGPKGELPEPQLVYQTLKAEAWPYQDFARSPHSPRWDNVEWVAFRHWLPKKHAEREFETEFPVTSKTGIAGTRLPKDAALQAQKSIEVWELWDRGTKTVKWISEEDQSKYLREMDDPLRLPNFFPMPPPLYSIEQLDTLIPVPEYSIYQDLACELQTITDRMNRIEHSIRVRGVYDGSIPELGRIFEASGETMLASDNVAKLRQVGGLQGAMWMLDNTSAVAVLEALANYRDRLIQAIYEITGISDIWRGASKASETATAQNLKARYGSLRIEPRQKAVEFFLRDLLRLWAEVMCEHFTAETLMQMTGVEVPEELKEDLPEALSEQEKDRIIWDNIIIPAMRNEVMLSYRIDVETDSTIADLTLADQSMLNELLGAVASFTQTMMPLVQAGAIPAQVSQALLMSVVRRSKLGPQVEDAIDQMRPEGGGTAETGGMPGATGAPPGPEEMVQAVVGEIVKLISESGIIEQVQQFGQGMMVMRQELQEGLGRLESGGQGTLAAIQQMTQVMLAMQAQMQAPPPMPPPTVSVLPDPSMAGPLVQ